jgi:hypothetical protein
MLYIDQLIYSFQQPAGQVPLLLSFYRRKNSSRRVGEYEIFKGKEDLGTMGLAEVSQEQHVERHRKWIEHEG